VNKIIPNKLNPGDEIRVIAPSRSMTIINEETIAIAKETLEKLGFKVTFGKNVNKSINDEYICASIEDRIEDLHDAFKDKKVKAILTVIGGYNVNQILDYIDYDLIKENPKIICGYSDITALLESIYAKTGLLTYYGPHFSTFGIKYENKYTIDYFKKMFMETNSISIKPSTKWSNDLWFIDQENRKFNENKGIEIISEGEAKGNIIGGNLCTLNLLQGTKYMPEVKDAILFIEDDGMAKEAYTKEFDRDFQSLIHSIGANNIKGIVVGRAEENCKMTYDKWKMIFETKKELQQIPIIINLDFGHTNPLFTFPIGGQASIKVKQDNVEVEISN